MLAHSRRDRQRFLFLRKTGCILAVLLIVVWGIVLLVDAIMPREDLLASSQAASTLYPSVSDRFGIGMNRSFGLVDAYDVARLKAGWYVDWGAQMAPLQPAGLDFVQVVYVFGDTFVPDEASLAIIVTEHPGATWLIGNEPDCIWQGNSTPDQYARVYHRLYTFIKVLDPTARVTIGGIVQATPLRLRWLDAVLAAYQAHYAQTLPVDLWNIHAFVLREERGAWGAEIPPGIAATQGMLWDIQDHDRMDLLRQQIVRFRTWMRDHGERDKELIISEYGILMPVDYGFTSARVETFMVNTFNYFLTATDPAIGHPADGNRLVQRWAWYSLNDDLFEGFDSYSHLFDPYTGAITPLGLAFANYMSSWFTPYVDLVSAAIYATPRHPLTSPGQPVRVTFQAVVRNAGNTDVHNVPVQFWVGDPGTPLGGARVIPALPARSWASVWHQWWGVPVGEHVVGVTVDGANGIVEFDEGNNQLSLVFRVVEHGVHLPIVFRGY